MYLIFEFQTLFFEFQTLFFEFQSLFFYIQRNSIIFKIQRIINYLWISKKKRLKFKE